MADETTSEDPDFKLILEYAEAIGLLTIYWAALENSLALTLEKLLRADEITAACITTSVDKAAGRAAIVQRLVLRPGEAPTDEWRDCMLGLCDQVMNKLGPKRNRLVHDTWTVSEDAIQRHNPALRIGKPSEREAKALLTSPPGPSHVPEIQALTSAVVDVMVNLVMLGVQYDIWKRRGLIPKVPEQAIRVSKGLPRELPQQDVQA